jgi:hypothetical protein
MKKLEEVKAIKEQLNEENRQAVLDTLIAIQIEGLEKILEGNGGYVKSAMAYNMCAGLIDQLKYYSSACFRDPANLVPGEPDWRDWRPK